MASIPAGGNVDEGFRLALTGTPGTGKSTVASLLSDAGFEVFTVESLAEDNDLKGELDSADGALVIDTDALHEALLEPWQTMPLGPVVVDESRDVKLGYGGIREAEFFVQTLQLIWGGQHPELRVPATLDALALRVMFDMDVRHFVPCKLLSQHIVIVDLREEASNCSA